MSERVVPKLVSGSVVAAPEEDDTEGVPVSAVFLPRLCLTPSAIIIEGYQKGGGSGWIGAAIDSLDMVVLWPPRYFYLP